MDRRGRAVSPPPHPPELAPLTGDAPLLLGVTRDRQITIAHQLARAAARWRIEPGEVVGVPVPPGGVAVCEVVASLLLLWARGAIALPHAAGAPAPVTAGIADAAGMRRVIDLGRGALVPAEDPPPRRSSGPLLPEGVAGLAVATSGSTGRPRVVLHRLDRLREGMDGAANAMSFGRSSSWLLSLPLHHIGGLAVVLRALETGGRVLVPAHRGTDALASAILGYRPTHLSLVPTQLGRLLDATGARTVLPRAVGVLVGGAPIPSRLRATAAELRIPLWVSYGSTETGAVCCLGDTPEALARRDAVGRPLPGRAVTVDDAGELRVKGDVLLAGYLEEGRRVDPRDPDGWVPTGDLGSIDDDGVVRVRGRRDRMFTVGGENVHPEEIEDVLLDHDGIEGAVVVPRFHHDLGAVPVAFIRRHPIVPVTLPALRAHLVDRVERWKRPREVWLLDDEDDDGKPSPAELTARLRDRAWMGQLRPLR